MRAIVFGLVAWVGFAGVLSACCMVPRTYGGTIGQSMQEAVVVHADGREELVVGIKYRMKPDQDGKMPPYFAWVITVPNEPDRYQLAERDLFKEVFRWGNPKMEKRSSGNGLVPRSEIDGGELVWSKVVKVGPYTIQPAKATGMAALKVQETTPRPARSSMVMVTLSRCA